MKPKANYVKLTAKEVDHSDIDSSNLENSDHEPKPIEAFDDTIKTTLHEHMLMMELRLASKQMKRSCRKTETEMQQLRDRLDSVEEQLQKLNTVITKVHDLLICEQNLLYNGYYSVNYKKNLH